MNILVLLLVYTIGANTTFNLPMCNSTGSDNIFRMDTSACSPLIIKNFQMLTPELHGNPSDSTVLQIWRDKRGILIKFINYTHNVKSIKKSVIMRDADLNRVDDYDGVLIASMDNLSEIYALLVNPLGTQKDLLSLNMGNSGVAWDGDWAAKAELFDKGWIAYFFIPFSDLPASSNREWRINFIRKNRSVSPSELYAAYIPSSGNILNLSQAPRVRLEDVYLHSSRLFINPFILGKILEDGEGNGIIIKRIGGEMEFSNRKKTSGVMFSIFPDFNFIEADAEHIIFDDYGYYLDEKRPFFLIKQDLYENSLLRTIYTRKIDSFDFGLNAYSNLVNKYQLNSFVLKRRISYSDSVQNLIDYLGILRYSSSRYDLQLNASGEKDLNSRSDALCVDFLASVYSSFANGFVQLSRTDGGIARALMFSKANDAGGASWSFYYQCIPANFHPPLGYLLIPANSDGFKKIGGEISWRKYINFSLLNSFEPQIQLLHETDGSGTLWRKILNGSLNFKGKRNIVEYEAVVNATLEKKVDEVDRNSYYDNFTQGGYIALRHENGQYYFSASINVGRYQGEKLFYPSISSYFNIGSNVHVNIYGAKLKEGNLMEEKLVYLRTRLKLSEKSTASIFSQWNNMYNELLLNFIYQYRVNSRTYLYVALNEIHRLTSEDIRRSLIGMEHNGIAIKITYKLGII